MNPRIQPDGTYHLLLLINGTGLQLPFTTQERQLRAKAELYAKMGIDQLDISVIEISDIVLANGNLAQNIAKANHLTRVQ